MALNVPKNMMCPLIDSEIRDYECMENIDTINGIVNFGNDESYLIDKFKKKENWREICTNCYWFKMA